MTTSNGLPGCEIWFTRHGHPAPTPLDLQWPQACAELGVAALAPWRLQALSGPVARVTTELVANAVQHGPAGHPAQMSLTRPPGIHTAVRIAVTNTPRWQRPDGPAGHASGGLAVVDRLATSWKIAPGLASTTVWCLIDLRTTQKDPSTSTHLAPDVPELPR
ncbi:ATP-binding protein [Streptomyces sp. NPDC059070]|uniref:ATP-binding protein n=1 Tax=Streptomyces sp. NPDC059070 TaxID=3346713 RepID=UPI0036B440A4